MEEGVNGKVEYTVTEYIFHLLARNLLYRELCLRFHYLALVARV